MIGNKKIETNAKKPRGRPANKNKQPKIRKNNIIPKDETIEQKRIRVRTYNLRSFSKNGYYCETCNRDYHLTSKGRHLKTKKHNKIKIN